MFNTLDPDSSKRITESRETVAEIIAGLKSGIGAELALISDDGRSHVVDLVLPGESRVRVEIISAVGNSRKETWSFGKFESFLSAGFLSVRDGSVHRKWIENSRPKPLSDEAKASINDFYRRHGFSWPMTPIPMYPKGSEAIIDLPADAEGEWSPIFAARDSDVRIWSFELPDGTEAYLSTTGERRPSARAGFADLAVLIDTMGYGRLGFDPAHVEVSTATAPSFRP